MTDNATTDLQTNAEPPCDHVEWLAAWFRIGAPSIFLDEAERRINHLVKAIKYMQYLGNPPREKKP